MQAYLYRWKLVDGREDDFVAAWTANTLTLRSLGSMGSRLHHASDGWWYGYAQWPDAEARTRAFAAADRLDDYVTASTVMRSAIAESMPAVVLDARADFLVAIE
jgi:hypothetical protein